MNEEIRKEMEAVATIMFALASFSNMKIVDILTGILATHISETMKEGMQEEIIERIIKKLRAALSGLKKVDLILGQIKNSQKHNLN